MTQEESRPSTTEDRPPNHAAADESTREEQATQFLSWLFSGRTDDQIGISKFEDADDVKRTRNTFHDSIASAVERAIELDDTGVKSTYFRLTTVPAGWQPAKFGGRAEAKDSAYGYGFMWDFDVTGPGHVSDKYPPDWESWEKVLDAACFPKLSGLIDSKGGFYPILKLTERTGDMERYTALFKALTQLLTEWVNHFGWKMDNTGESARVYSLPGTHRRKAGDSRIREAVFLDGPAYTLHELEGALRDAPRPIADQGKPEDLAFSEVLDSGGTALFGVGEKVIREGDRTYFQSEVSERLREPTDKVIDLYVREVGGGDFREALIALARQVAHYYPIETARSVILGIWTEHGSKRADGGWTALDEKDENCIVAGYGYQAKERAAEEAAGVPFDKGWTATVIPDPVPENRGGWEAVNLEDILSGKREKVVPALGARADGQALFYRGKEHSIASEPEAGKTWFVTLQVKAMLEAGLRVVYCDFEDDANTIVGERLVDGLGVAPDTIRAGLRYASPEVKPAPKWYEELLTWGEGQHADMVVLDGVTEGMGLLGLKVNEQEAAVEWRSIFVKPATRLGAATLSTDHEVKRKEDRGRFAIGAQHKLAGLNGVMFKLEQERPMGRGLKGKSRVTITKDRNGGLRQYGESGEAPGVTYLGDLVVDATGAEAKVAFYAPMKDESTLTTGEGGPPRDISKAVEAITAVLKKHPEGLNQTQALAGITGKATVKRDALAWLVREDKVLMSKVGQSYHYTLGWTRGEVDAESLDRVPDLEEEIAK